jgi:hypothetical protein
MSVDSVMGVPPPRYSKDDAISQTHLRGKSAYIKIAYFAA